MTVRWDELTSGGLRSARVAFALVVEGIQECFTDDPALIWRAASPFTAGASHRCYRGLVVENGDLKERATWPEAKLDSSGFVVRIQEDSHDERWVASRVFGGRLPAARTYLTAKVNSTATTLPVVSTTGFAATGVVHLGREAIHYTHKDATNFLGCTRGYYSSFAVAHSYTYNESRAEAYAEAVTDVPVTIEGRRCQLWALVNGETTGTVYRRGIVAHGGVTADRTGYSVTCDSNTRLLEQDFGETLKPFGMRGFYFPAPHPLIISLYEYEHGARLLRVAATDRFITLQVTGFFETEDHLIDELNAQANAANWQDASGTTGLRYQNRDVRFEIASGQIVIRYVTGNGGEAGHIHMLVADTSRHVGGWTSTTQIPGVAFSQWTAPTKEDGTRLSPWEGLQANKAYTILSLSSEPLPVHWTGLFHSSADVARYIGTANPPNRLYYQGDVPSFTLLNRLFMKHTRGRSAEPLRVVGQDTTAGFLEVELERRAVWTTEGSAGGIYDTDSDSWTFEPALSFGTRRWDEVFVALINDTPTRSTDGITPYLPLPEFDTADITSQSILAGGNDLRMDWLFNQSANVADVFRGALQLLGLCWVTQSDGRITVRPLAVAASSAYAVRHLDGSILPSESEAWAANADGIYNVVWIRGGWDPHEEKYLRGDVAAQVPASFPEYGKRTLTIEPKGMDLPRSALADIDRRARLGIRLVSVYSRRYYHVEIRNAGVGLFDVLLGDVVSLTAPHVPHEGARGMTRARALVVGRTHRLRSTPEGFTMRTDLELMVSTWRTAGYAPAAMAVASGPLSGSVVTFRLANQFSTAPRSGAGFFDFYYFQPGDKVRIIQIDTTSDVQENLTILDVDTSTGDVTFTTAPTLAMNTAGTRWVMVYQTHDNATNSDGDPAQQDYCAIADSAFLIGAANLPARELA